MATAKQLEADQKRLQEWEARLVKSNAELRVREMKWDAEAGELRKREQAVAQLEKDAEIGKAIRVLKEIGIEFRPEAPSRGFPFPFPFFGR